MPKSRGLEHRGLEGRGLKITGSRRQPRVGVIDLSRARGTRSRARGSRVVDLCLCRIMMPESGGLEHRGLEGRGLKIMGSRRQSRARGSGLSISLWLCQVSQFLMFEAETERLRVSVEIEKGKIFW
ncbi:hypothetical protein CRG98_033836 [Punica granatum]|uniref:Uncharacterized protein n=1 Tax=Punica granatum TaxID=22663 RepID=A0A2I0IPB3_PUNGR|nr:hypothetical protein CRG98_033836 [Punica granatum]